MQCQEVTEGVFFTDTNDNQCKFPLWGPDEKIGNVCGKKVVIGRGKNGMARRFSWCPTHLSIVESK